ncbi:MAG: hypothetical protein R3B13_25960 [Polyangiaceae bacterium]
MPSEPKRVSELRASGTTHPGLGHAEVIRVDPISDLSRRENELGAVLAASNRAEASLSALYRAIQQVTEGVSDARDANEALTRELSRVRDLLGASNEDRLALRNQVELLRQRLEVERAAASEEREFLIAEQDRFLVGLLHEHDEQLSRLVAEREHFAAELAEMKRSIAGTHPALKAAWAEYQHEGPAQLLARVERLTDEAQAGRDALRRLQAQRDDAHARLAMAERQLADVREEVARLRAAGITAPPDPRRTLPATPATFEDGPQPAPREAPAQLERALVAAKTPSDARRTDPHVPHPAEGSNPHTAEGSNPPKPPLKRKPDPTSHPLGGYSVGGEAVEAERVLSSKPKP